MLGVAECVDAFKSVVDSLKCLNGLEKDGEASGEAYLYRLGHTVSVLLGRKRCHCAFSKSNGTS